jgi:hypothetical protein
VAWIVTRELRTRDRSIKKMPQGAAVHFRHKTNYAGLNQDGLSCGMLVDGDNIKIFMLENTELSVSSIEIPLDLLEEEDPYGEGEFIDAQDSLLTFASGGGKSFTLDMPPSPYRCCVPYLVVKGAGLTVHEDADKESKKIGHFKRGEMVNVLSRSTSGGPEDTAAADAMLLLLSGGWVRLFSDEGDRNMHPQLDCTHRVTPEEVQVCSTNLTLKKQVGFWSSLFSKETKKLDVQFIIRLSYSVSGENFGYREVPCELLLQRSLEEFVAMDGRLRKRASTGRRAAAADPGLAPTSSSSSTRYSTRYSTSTSTEKDVLLPLSADMTEDLLLMDDGAQVMADQVASVQDWLVSKAAQRGGVINQFLTPSERDWLFMESSLHISGNIVVV